LSESKPKLTIEECCRQFYDKGIFHSIVAGQDVWSGLLDTYFKSVAEADKSFLSIDPTLFRNEMTALRMELFAFALGCSKKFNADKFTLPASFFTTSYLEENGRLDILDIMAEYNQAIARSAVMDANLKQYSGSTGNAVITSANDLRSRTALKWAENIIDDTTLSEEERNAKISCVNLIANRLGADIEREDGVVVKSLCVRLVARLGCDVSLNSEALFRLSAIIYGFYNGAEEYLKSVEIQE